MDELAVTSARDRFNHFVSRHEVAWELGMGALAIIFVLLGFAADDATEPLRSQLDLADIGLTGVFVAEFASRFAASYDRRHYLRSHWIDLIALVPMVRGVRVLRLLRLLRMVRAFAGLYRALGHVQAVAQHRGMAWLFTAWLGVMVLCSLALYTAERGANAAVNSPLDALWWGIVTLTTVGYGDVVPVTPEGRLAASVLMLLGITLFGAITATITSYLISTSEAVPDPLEGLRRLAELRDAGVVTADEFEAKKTDLLARF